MLGNNSSSLFSTPLCFMHMSSFNPCTRISLIVTGFFIVRDNYACLFNKNERQREREGLLCAVHVHRINQRNNRQTNEENRKKPLIPSHIFTLPLYPLCDRDWLLTFYEHATIECWWWFRKIDLPGKSRPLFSITTSVAHLTNSSIMRLTDLVNEEISILRLVSIRQAFGSSNMWLAWKWSD